MERFQDSEQLMIPKVETLQDLILMSPIENQLTVAHLLKRILFIQIIISSCSQILHFLKMLAITQYSAPAPASAQSIPSTPPLPG